uniref:Oxysterol-binding protein n=1 Tax=Globodera rostochiensis TaxID=31243 RepID=A0A914HRP5_GLORO
MTKKRPSISSSNFFVEDTGSNSTCTEATGKENKTKNGYRQRWFVLDADGILSYYRHPSEVNRACRGTINLSEANIHSNQGESSHNLVITTPSALTFHLKASNEIDRSQWLKTLEYAKHMAIKQAVLLEDDEEQSQLFLIKTKGLKEPSTERVENMAKDIRSFSVKFYKELDGLTHYVIGHCSAKEAKNCAEKINQLRTLSDRLIENSNELVSNYKEDYGTLLRLANSQHEKYLELQRQYKILARQHSKLERDAYRRITDGTISAENLGTSKNEKPPYVEDATPGESDEDEDADEETFHDATDNLEEMKQFQTQEESVEEREAPEEEQDIVGKFTCEPRMSNFELRKCIFHFPADSATRNYTENTTPTVFIGLPNIDRRTSVPPKPQSHGLNLWSIMRNCIGKELTRIPIPVNFNEPLSMLQRITEDLEYSYLLDRAAEKEDICERLAYVAAFAVSCYSATAVRTTKPFNPLLGETFEFDRRADLGWRSLVEQVSHHPPAAAHHVEGINWLLHQEFMVSSRFRGKYLSVVPTGHTHVSFRDGKAHLTFQKVTTTVHNIIVGRLWIDNHGEMSVVNHLGGERAVLKFDAYSYFSSNRPRKVEGVILDRRGEPRFCLEGFWNEHVNIANVVGRRMDEKGHLVIQTGEKRRVWTANAPSGDASQYNFTKLAIEMNEPDGSVAPTDSRRRPDQRLMEDGRWDEANKLKNQLEERQRKVRRQTEAEAERAMNNNQLPSEYHARWFRKVQDPHTGSVIHVVRDDEYWRCKASQDCVIYSTRYWTKNLAYYRCWADQMKLLKRSLQKDSSGFVRLICEEDEDMWHIYNLAMSQRVQITLTIEVETIDFDTSVCALHLKGKNIKENQHVKLGAYHTLDLELNRTFTLEKPCWDAMDLHRLELCSDISNKADVAGIVMHEGLANVCLIGSSMTVVKSKIDMQIARKRKGLTSQHDKSLVAFMNAICVAFFRHVNIEYIEREGLKQQFAPHKGKFVLVHSSSGFKHALKEALSDNAVAQRLSDTKAQTEVKALNTFLELMCTDPQRAVYGYRHVVHAREQQSIDTLMVSDSLFRSKDIAQRRKYVNLVESIKYQGATVLIFSSMHVTGEQLTQLTGVAAILRFPISDLDDEDWEEENDAPPNGGAEREEGGQT